MEISSGLRSDEVDEEILLPEVASDVEERDGRLAAASQVHVWKRRVGWT
jgi:hypothetical protein